MVFLQTSLKKIYDVQKLILRLLSLVLPMFKVVNFRYSYSNLMVSVLDGFMASLQMDEKQLKSF